jgi:hypothetical protein
MASILTALEQSGLATWIREAGVLYGYPLILFLHTLGLSTLVGLNSAIDIRLLGVGSAIPLASLEKTFSLMWAGLVLTATTGSLLFIADANRHASNPAYSVKLACVALAVAILVRIRSQVFRKHESGRLLAVFSLGFWFVALSAGRLMAYINEFIS